jgi:uncharacterized repeat protein (TIGR01451 family)
VSDTAFVTVMSGGQNPAASLAKLGRNVTRGEASPHAPVSAAPVETIEFVINVQNTANTTISNAVVQDSMPQGVTPIAGSVRVDGAAAPDALTGSGLSLGTLTPGQGHTILFSGQVAPSAQLPAGVTNVLNTVHLSAPSITTLTAQLPIIITNNVAAVAGVSTGPGQSTVLALIVSGIITLLYVGYTGTETYRRREAEGLAKEAKKDTTSFNFRR